MLHYRYASFTVLMGLIALAGLIFGGISPTLAAKSVDPEHAILLPVVFKKDFDLKVNSVMVIQGTTPSESYPLSLANRETIAGICRDGKRENGRRGDRQDVCLQQFG